MHCTRWGAMVYAKRFLGSECGVWGRWMGSGVRDLYRLNNVWGGLGGESGVPGGYGSGGDPRGADVEDLEQI